ncbi:MAG TPA: serine hydrolase [Methylomirabilota bacterium]|nr:serine hydrolase [Methylomirabilota bacterium]
MRNHPRAHRLAVAAGWLGTVIVATSCWAGAPNAVFPGAEWERRKPEDLGLVADRLDALRDLVGGDGCVVRHGYLTYVWGDPSRSHDVASAFKPVLSALLVLAVQEGRLQSVEDRVAEVDPRLQTLNGGKDAGMTWRHLASQTSAYGLIEPPGAAYAYNDYAITLYYDTLMTKVFREPGDQVLRTRLAEPLQFQDRHTFNAFGTNDRPGRLALSVRDFARFGLLILREGRWRDRQLIQPAHVRLLVDSPLSPATPLASGREAAMLPGQRTMGGGKTITRVGPGYYSFNWWLNRTNALGQRLFVDAPPDAIVASGHGGRRTLWLLPRHDLIVCWNGSRIEDHDQSPGNPATRCNQAARLMVAAVRDRAPEDNPDAKRTSAGRMAAPSIPSRAHDW